ncbi:unnamed protein product, partial [Haemonchus placei]|uniref:RING-type domain-containing protein n=1 Tax=Haemonchus placei TaxID=6290 RepID=A0A0N4X7K6_HAEPC
SISRADANNVSIRPCCEPVQSTSYDLRFCAPHSLPCAHTFCLMCLSKEKQRKKRRCPSCRKKYSSFILNTALAEVVKRVRQRRECLEHRSLRCDECDSRRPATAMRRCLSCSRAMNKHMSAGLTLDCIICLECCVNRHNGHDLTTLPSQPFPSLCRRKLIFLPYTSLVIRKFKKLITNANFRPKPDHRKPRVPAASSMIDDELVYEARSPLYCQLYCVLFTFNMNIHNASILYNLRKPFQIKYSNLKLKTSLLALVLPSSCQVSLVFAIQHQNKKNLFIRKNRRIRLIVVYWRRVTEALQTVEVSESLCCLISLLRQFLFCFLLFAFCLFTCAFICSHAWGFLYVKITAIIYRFRCVSLSKHISIRCRFSWVFALLNVKVGED